MMQRLLPMLYCLLAACSSPAGGSAPPAGDTPGSSVVRIIVAFDAPAAPNWPDSAEVLARLSESLEGEVAYLHEISGNAAVYRVATSLDPAELQQRLASLAGREGIRYAELDRRRTRPAPVGEPK